MKDNVELEIREGHALAERDLIVGGVTVLVTPPIDEEWWLFRVRLSEDQAIVGFPKFGVIGVGFVKEDNWNTNLPSSCSAEMIFDHISHNKGDPSISDEDCIRAIRLVQEAVAHTEVATP